MNKNYNSNIIRKIENEFIKTTIPEISIGDSIKLKLLIKEGSKERIQTTGGIVIAKHKNYLQTSITVRKIIYNIGVERIYLIHSPLIKHIEIISRAKVKRSKLYYLRNKFGKASKLKRRV
uniref:Large ribosomal subunit protein bL19c n=1 Tax=Taenioma perpusillum TaxID=210852 RepID=A0A1Z1MS38_9FLOR|nr:ribosomal protein L19 [Taenioma perpusillum]ARW68581.1 ribosomal protein L19 [Taenioma perpusillum]